MRADAETSGNIPYRITPFRNLLDGINLKFFSKSWLAHDGLLVLIFGEQSVYNSRGYSHDIRIISAIEKIFEAGLLAPIQFIGERKAFLSIVLAARFRYSDENDTVQRDYIRQLEKISRDIEGDSWNLQIGYYDRTGPFHQTESAGMIACSDAQEDTYLRNIDNLWNLGTWEFHHRYRLRHEIQPLDPEMLSPPQLLLKESILR